MVADARGLRLLLRHEGDALAHPDADVGADVEHEAGAGAQAEIAVGAGEHDLERYARTMTPSIRDDGVQKILSGVTTLEEVLRVTRGD